MSSAHPGGGTLMRSLRCRSPWLRACSVRFAILDRERHMRPCCSTTTGFTPSIFLTIWRTVASTLMQNSSVQRPCARVRPVSGAMNNYGKQLLARQTAWHCTMFSDARAQWNRSSALPDADVYAARTWTQETPTPEQANRDSTRSRGCARFGSKRSLPCSPPEAAQGH